MKNNVLAFLILNSIQSQLLLLTQAASIGERAAADPYADYGPETTATSHHHHYETTTGYQEETTRRCRTREFRERAAANPFADYENETDEYCDEIPHHPSTENPHWSEYLSSTTTTPTTTPYYYHWTTSTTEIPRPYGYPAHLPWPPVHYMSTATTTESPFPYGMTGEQYGQYVASLAAAGYPLPAPLPTTAAPPPPPVQVCDLSAWPDCQCIKQYKDMYTEDGRGNCNVGAAKSDLQVWCYVNPDTAVCPDIKPSKNYQGKFYSRFACITE